MNQNKNTYTKELSVAGDLSELANVRSFVETCAEECGFEEHSVYQIALAVDEACSNLMRHAYNLRSGTFITLKVEATPSCVVISIFDAAFAFDPLQVVPPDMNEYFASYRRGGLGVQLMKRVMDTIEYFPANANQHQNELRLTKYHENLA